MNWGGWENFWAMGGRGFYVWGSYGVTVLALALEVLAVRKRRRNALAAAAREQRAKERKTS